MEHLSTSKAGSAIQATKNHTKQKNGKILKKFRIFRKLFARFVLSKNFPNKWHRDDSFGPKIVEFRVILAIFRTFEDRNQTQQTILVIDYIRDMRHHIPLDGVKLDGVKPFRKKVPKVTIKIGMSIAIAIGFVFLILRSLPLPLAFAIPRRPLPE